MKNYFLKTLFSAKSNDFIMSVMSVSDDVQSYNAVIHADTDAELARELSRCVVDGVSSNCGTLLTETANKDHLSVCLSVWLLLCVFDCVRVCVMSSVCRACCAPGSLIITAPVSPIMPAIVSLRYRWVTFLLSGHLQHCPRLYVRASSLGISGQLTCYSRSFYYSIMQCFL